MNIEDYYFYAIRPYKMFNKKNYDYDIDFINETCQILESIIKHKLIMCRKSLSNICNIEELNDKNRTNWNGMTSVSTCIYPTKIRKNYYIDEETYEFYKEKSAFYEWVNNGYLTLLIKPEISELLSYDGVESDDNYYIFHQPDEIRFYGDIPFDYVDAILFMGDNNKLIKFVKDILEKNKINIPVINLKVEDMKEPSFQKVKKY